jgi:DNA adenine methylase
MNQIPPNQKKKKNLSDSFEIEELILSEDESSHEAEPAEKGVRQAFGSYGGKRALAHKIASFIPYHKTYVEPFAGGAAVLFAKDPSPQEVINDRDSEIAFMYRFIRDHTQEQRTALAKRNWEINKDTHERLKRFKPSTEMDRFYKAYYLTRSSYGKQRGGSFNPANAGVTIDFENNITRAQQRLKNIAIHNKDYAEVLKKYDGEDTFFYIDPPYPGTFNLFDFGFQEEKFVKMLNELKADWIVSYTAERAAAFKGFHVNRVKRRNQMRGPGGNQEWVTELLVSKNPLKPVNLYIDKDLDSKPEGMEAAAPEILTHLDETELLDVEKIQGAFKSPGGKFRLCKKLVPLIPEHKTFVEGFCGGAQVFFHKKRSDEEVLNDVNPDLIFAYRFIKTMPDDDLDWLKKQEWTISRAHVKRVFEKEPKSPRERFYRVAYLNKANYWGRTDRIEGLRHGNQGEGYEIQLVKRLPQIQERLQGVKLTCKDWKEVIDTFDSNDAFFYLDPPYPLHWPRETGVIGPKFFKEEDLLPTLKNIKGRFLLSYELEKSAMFKGFKTYRIKTAWTGANHLGFRKKYELLVSNYPIKESDLYVED